MTVRNSSELDALKRIGALAGQARDLMAEAVRAGMSTAELDKIGAEFLREHGAESAPQKVYGFPGFNCISLNDEIVHGIPSARTIAPGDLVKVDVTAQLEGFIADTATTVLVPPEQEEGKKLLECAKAAFQRAMKVVKAGTKVNEVGRAVHQETRARGFAVVRELCGHGVGRTIHESPEVANYFNPYERALLTEGLVIAVEPILSARAARAVQDEDGWTMRTSNHCLAVHYEHTVVVTRGEPIILTAA